MPKSDKDVVRVTKHDFKSALVRHGGDYAKQVLKDPKLMSDAFELMKSAVEKHPCGVAASALSGISEIADKSTVSPTLKYGVKSVDFVVSQFRLSTSLRVIDALSPGKAMTVIGATMAVKTGLMLGMMGDDQRKTACAGALMEVGGNAAITAVTWETGIGAALGAAALVTSGISAYQTCTGSESGAVPESASSTDSTPVPPPG